MGASFLFYKEFLFLQHGVKLMLIDFQPLYQNHEKLPFFRHKNSAASLFRYKINKTYQTSTLTLFPKQTEAPEICGNFVEEYRVCIEHIYTRAPIKVPLYLKARDISQLLPSR